MCVFFGIISIVFWFYFGFFYIFSKYLYAFRESKCVKVEDVDVCEIMELLCSISRSAAFCLQPFNSRFAQTVIPFNLRSPRCLNCTLFRWVWVKVKIISYSIRLMVFLVNSILFNWARNRSDRLELVRRINLSITRKLLFMYLFKLCVFRLI